MIGRLLSSGETSAALVVVLSATAMALVAKGNGPLSSGRLVARVLPDHVSRREPRVEQSSRFAA